MFAENQVGLGSCSLIPWAKSVPTHEKCFCLGKNVAQMPLLTFFSWVGLTLGWGVRRFRSNICMFPNPTSIWYEVNRKHPSDKAAILRTLIGRGVYYKRPNQPTSLFQATAASQHLDQTRVLSRP